MGMRATMRWWALLFALSAGAAACGGDGPTATISVASITWRSGSPGVATVDGQGRASAVASGSTTETSRRAFGRALATAVEAHVLEHFGFFRPPR